MSCPTGDDVALRTNPETLSSWILTTQHLLAPSARGNLTILLNATCVACKFVQSAVRKAGLAGVLGLAGGPQNVQGEDQKKLDILANDVFISCLGRSGQVAAMVSEEDDAPIVVEDSTGDYVVVFDPLDGSSNIDCGVSIGTIFGIYRKPDKETSDAAAAAPSSSSSPAAAAEGALRPGRDLVAAGYCLYGSSCMLVLCLGETPPSVFTLDPSLGEFLLTQSCVRVPESGGIYSINEGNAVLWDKGTAEYIDRCKGLSSGGGGGGKEGEKDGKSCEAPKSARYVGSMVADVHRTLLYGGVFCYPADRKSKDGKLRLLYEGAPMARIITAAGGRAIAGPGVDVLDLMPTTFHGRCPVFLGSKADVDEAEACLAADPEHLQARK